jgi:hypothetical protein
MCLISVPDRIFYLFRMVGMGKHGESGIKPVSSLTAFLIGFEFL